MQKNCRICVDVKYAEYADLSPGRVRLFRLSGGCCELDLCSDFYRLIVSCLRFEAFFFVWKRGSTSLTLPSPLQVVALNKRSKEAESAFLGIYKQLIEAPGE